MKKLITIILITLASIFSFANQMVVYTTPSHLLQINNGQIEPLFYPIYKSERLDYQLTQTKTSDKAKANQPIEYTAKSRVIVIKYSNNNTTVLITKQWLNQNNQLETQIYEMKAKKYNDKLVSQSKLAYQQALENFK